MAMGIVIAVLWFLAAILVLTEFAPSCAEVKKKDKIIAGIILIVGAPIFFAYSALSALLDCILPSGWEDDERK